eukprot:3671993-Pleurochrysis_carterae.AAC.1
MRARTKPDSPGPSTTRPPEGVSCADSPCPPVRVAPSPFGAPLAASSASASATFISAGYSAARADRA